MTEKTFADWLNQPDNFKYIQKLATGIQQRLAAANLRLPGIEHESDPRNAHEVISQELLIFLMQAPKIQSLLIHDPAAAAGAVIRSFLNEARDRIRSSIHNRDVYKDNWRAFRRHVLAVLRESDQFIKFPCPRDVAFGMSDTAGIVFIPPEVTAEIPFPPDVPADFERMNHKKHILRLAVHFWDHCGQLSGRGPVRINLNDFISWIGNHILLQVSPEPPTEDDSPISHISAPGQSHEKRICLETWAKNFYNRLDPRRKKIFYYYECAGYTGRQVAELMGRKSHLSYQRHLIQEDLKQFLCPLDWLSPAPEKGNAPADPDAFRYFMENLCAALGRNMEKDG